MENLEDRIMCKKHNTLLELFCRTDQTCVCQFCIETDHKTHHIVHLEEECGERKAQLGKTEAQVQQMIQERMQKGWEIKHSVELSKRDAEREIADSMQVFTDLVHFIERSQAELIEVVEEKQKAAEKRAEGFIKELEQEINELLRRSTELKQLSHTEDHLHLLQSSPSLCTPPNAKNWSDISIHTELVNVRRVLRNSVSELEEKTRKAFSELMEKCNKAMEKFPDNLKFPDKLKIPDNLKSMKQYAVDVTLDPDTANPFLGLSADRKQVSVGQTWNVRPENPKRFVSRCILGKEGFSSGRFYYEVQMEGRICWELGVARESINRSIERQYLGSRLDLGLPLTPEGGFWTVGQKNMFMDTISITHAANTSPSVTLTLKKPQKMGVFVDYEEGQVSFYNVETRAHIFSFTGCNFTEKLYPFFDCGIHDDNSQALIISAVSHTD
ncbi:E3 ubiquitin-protein ligase TRIM39-like [Coregonus clupeaformis]|uniref:E3 ubiquitin-protein ligase TRIM39-like n=1 Tax=Coregonus clupeaformis TaxID=59861 RepID=UPI001E1C71B2|nr:E3 ubiquitin-protein ligase TRIM39-like [Coregonus clupeaformis]